MPRCLPWFSKNKNYVINKNAVKVGHTNTTTGLKIRKASDYDRILNTPSAPSAKPILPSIKNQNNNHNNKNFKQNDTSIKNVQHESKEIINHESIGYSVDDSGGNPQTGTVHNEKIQYSANLEEPSLENEDVAHECYYTEVVKLHPSKLINSEEENKTQEESIETNIISETTRIESESTEFNGINESVDEYFIEPDVSTVENLQDSFEDDKSSNSFYHRPTIVELKLQDDASSFVSFDVDVSRDSEIISPIDNEIDNVNFDEEIPQIFRRSGLRTEIVDINKNISKYEKTLEEIQLINEALCKNEFLKTILTESTQKLIVDIMTPKDVPKDEIVILQGEPGDYMYVSEFGHFQVTKDDIEVYSFNRNEVFGEVAIIYNHKRQATVKAVTNGKIWQIKRDDYYRVMVNSARKQESEIITFLQSVPTIKDAPLSRLNQAVGLFTLQTFTTDINIVSEGEEGNEFFIIKAGNVKVTKKNDVIAKLGRGQFFGEQALLNNDKKRQATVTAESPVVECLVLSIAYFKDLFGDLAEFMTVPILAESTNPVIDNEYSNIKLETLKLKTTLGVGGFGRVELAHLIKDDKKTFALKYLKRKRIVENEQIEHVFNEKLIQMQCSSPFIVQLYKTYNDRKYLYLLLELCLGGDIINLLQRQRLHCCREEDTKFLTACVLEALSYLHKRNFVFRDLKPENMMLDQRGYVKLTDFGFAKKLDHGERTYTFAGTPEYVAPEIIYQRGHDRAVDYWALGIFIFELLVGKTPFKTSDPSYMQTYNLIVRGIENVIFPTKVKTNATSLIKKLCNATPSERIGYKRQGIQEIREHRWFQGFNWEKLQSCRMSSPFQPKLANHIDTKYFDRQRPDRDIPDDDFTAVLDNF